MNKYRKKALIYLVIASVLWSIGGVFIKLVEWNPVAIAGARSGIAAIVMMIYMRRPVTRLGKFKLLGGCSYALLVMLFVTANKLTSSANAIFLQNTAPIWIALFSRWFLKERIERYDWVTIVVVMMGMTLFFIGDLNSGNIKGNFIAVLSGIAMAGVVIFLKLQKEDSPLEMTVVGNIITFIIAIPFFFISVPNLRSILGLLILGVFQLGISYIFYTTAIKYVSTVEAILIPILEPLLNPVWVFWGTGEAPSVYAVLGGALVIITITIRCLYHQRKMSKLEQAEGKLTG